MSPPTGPLLVIGTGLIGTSVALAQRGERDVLLHDTDPRRVAVAAERGAGRAWDGREQVALAVVAVPPSVTAAVVARVLTEGVASHVTHVCSVQSDVQRDVETLVGPRVSQLCGGHPMAGRETSGPEAAVGSLFAGRPWVICPSSATTPATEAAVTDLAASCGGVPTRLAAGDHDRAVGLVSHLPQLVASSLAARVAQDAAAGALALAGPGLADMTRLAASEATMWTAILRANAAHVAPALQRLAADLSEVAGALEASEGAAVQALLERGAAARALLPVKRDLTERDLSSVWVVLPDQPGALAALLARVAQAGVNVEDLRLDHLSGRPTGVVELVVAASSAPPAQQALAAAGFELPAAGPAGR